tara:strand:+ start:1438 stop:3633 length:2196 start_codon:yes stop_codon:yes gene_type:complete
MVVPTYKLRVKWDTTGEFDQSGAELSARLLGLEWWSGRDNDSQLIGKSVAGGLVAILNNNSGDYSPLETGSPLAGNVAPNREVRLTASGRAAQFTKANSESLSAVDSASLSTGNIDFHIGCWVYMDSKSADMFIMGKWLTAGDHREYRLFFDQSEDRFRFEVSANGDSTVVNIDADDLGSPSVATWYFINCWHDATANTINIQVDDGTADSAAHAGGLADKDGDFSIGAEDGDGDPFDGRIESAFFTKEVYTAAERTFLHRDGDGVQYSDIGLTGDGSNLKASLIGWWDLQEASGNRADSENDNTLTDNNTVTDAEGIPNLAQWGGFIKDVEPIPSLGGLNAARLIAIGPLGQVNLDKLRLAMATSEATGTAVGRILTEAGWSTDDRTIDAGQTTMTRFWLENEVRTIAALRRVESTETGFIAESKDGRIAFEDRRHRQQVPHTTSQGTFTDATAGALAYSGIRELDSQQQLFHIFTVGIQTYTIASLAVLWTLSASGADSPAITPGQTLTFWAEYPNPDSATNAFGVDAWTTPVENTDYEANTQAGGGGDDRSASLGFTVTKFGNSMKMEIINNHATDTVFLTLLQGRGTGITRDDPARIMVETAATHQRTFPSPPLHLPSVSEGFDWCNWHNGIFSNILPLLDIDVIANRSVAQMLQVLDRKLSDRITLVADNGTGLGINEDFFIEQMRHTVDPRRNIHTVRWGLSAAASQQAWTLGSSDLGGETRLGY